VSASKRLGAVAYDAPVAELAEFTQRMFEIFANDALDSSSMQELAFAVLEQTRNLPFKLPQEAIYILRVSAIIEGLGTTYIENFNGIKDILPILQRNIPRALGMKESIIETIIDEIKHIPQDVQALRETLRRASRGELVVELSPLQLESIAQNIQNALRPIVVALMLALGAMGAWMGGVPEIAYGLLGAAMMRLWYR
jgi:predicted unusual protein kinase regulating ubiquinone biosynthesis (AarF/ABC1/UbiB family)